MKRVVTFALLASALTSGCARELVVRSEAAAQYTRGLPVPLAFTQYEVKATWRVASCTVPGAAVALTVDASPHIAIDDSHSFFIDPTSLAGPLTRSQLQVFYFENGTLRSINAEAEDRTGAFVGNVARIVGQLAPLGSGAAGSRSLADPQDSIDDFCRDETRDALARVSSLKSQLDDATALVDQATGRVLQLAAVAAQMGDAVDPVTSRDYGAATRELNRVRDVQAGLIAQLSNALRPITHQQTIRWPEVPTEFDRPQALAPGNVLSRWFEAVPAEANREAYLRIEGARPGAAATPAAAANVPERIEGIPYRVPRPGRLVMCSKPCGTDGAERRPLVEGMVAQLGPIAVLPVRNPAFGSTAVSAEFRPDGSLATAGHAQRAAPLEQASAALAGAAGDIVPLIDPVQRLARETAYLEALKERRDAWAALNPAPTSAAQTERAALEADTSILNAEISNMQARLTLQELQARMAAR